MLQFSSDFIKIDIQGKEERNVEIFIFYDPQSQGTKTSKKQNQNTIYQLIINPLLEEQTGETP